MLLNKFSTFIQQFVGESRSYNIYSHVKHKNWFISGLLRHLVKQVSYAINTWSGQTEQCFFFFFFHSPAKLCQLLSDHFVSEEEGAWRLVLFFQNLISIGTDGGLSNLSHRLCALPNRSENCFWTGMDSVMQWQGRGQCGWCGCIFLDITTIFTCNETFQWVYRFCWFGHRLLLPSGGFSSCFFNLSSIARLMTQSLHT